MSKKKLLALVLALSFCFCIFVTSNASAANWRIVDIDNETDTFSCLISPYGAVLNHTYYYPYVNTNPSGDLVIKVKNYDGQPISVHLYDADDGGRNVDVQKTESYRTNLYFKNLNPNHLYFFQVCNAGSSPAELEFYIC